MELSLTCFRAARVLEVRLFACVFDPLSRYAVGSEEKQGSFTAKQQRDGVCILPFVFAGLFGRRDGNPDHAADVTPDGADAAELQQPDEDQGYEADEDEDVDKIKPGFRYDWSAYRARFGDTLLHEAVTHMFAEYACLYSRIAGQVGSSVPPPLTLNVAEDISQQATRFVVEYVTPILGQVNSTKFHRLLSHILLAIRMHGNLRNGNTAPNESQHKQEKSFYERTSKQPASFTAQLVRQAQGSRALLERLDEDDAAAQRAAGQRQVGQLPASGTDTDSSDFVSSGDGRAPAGAGGVAGGERGRAPGSMAQARRPAAAARRGGGSSASASGAAQQPTTAHHLNQRKVEDISRRPGLANLSSLLGLPPGHFVPVMGHVRISAKFDCGRRAPQIVRASRCFRESPWLDTVIYSANTGENTAFVGEVRALLRRPDGDVAIVCEMAPVNPVPGCPLAARGCTRLRWVQRPGEADCALRVVPVADIRRVVHVVPDFLDLSVRRGIAAAPASEEDPLDDRLAMRYFLNVFYPWDVPR